MQEIRRSFLWLALAWGAAVALLIADAVIVRAQSESRSAGIERETRATTNSTASVFTTKTAISIAVASRAGRPSP